MKVQQLKALERIENFDLVRILLASTTNERVALRAWRALRASQPTGDLFRVDLDHYGPETGDYYFRLQVLAGMDAKLTVNAMATSLQRNWRRVDGVCKAWLAKSEPERELARKARADLIRKGQLQELPFLEMTNQRAYLERA
jgi:hypothetical protein